MKTYLQLNSLVLMLMFLCVSECVVVCCLLLLLILIIVAIFFFIARPGIVICICGGALIITLGLFTILRIKIITGNFSSPHPLIIVMQQFQNWVRIMRQNLPVIIGEEEE